MPTPEEIRNQIEKYASAFYSQALNLTLSNPLLRIPALSRSARFLEFDDSHMARAIRALIDTERSLTFLGDDATPRELALASASMHPGARSTLWLDVAMKHERAEAILRNLAKLHDQLLEKRGLPCAYVGIGFLRWVPEDGKVTRAPLLLVPVEIDAVSNSDLRKTVITLRLSERDTCENPVLREFLRLKHGLDLPKFEFPFEPTSARIQEWIEEAEAVTATKPSWTIEEGGIFGLFDCGAIAADCDTKNWSFPLHERELVQKLLLSTHTEDSKLPPAQFIPDALVLPADGSQLEALQHAAAGTNIVLHGPPGSGKSQTIVNLIAQSLSMGKSVLFVAQKPEAAHVVQRRLAEVGLAPFCSVLVPVGDSRNVKGAVLEGLRTREYLNPANAPELKAERDCLKQHLELIERYAQALPINLPNLEMTARETLAELAVHSINEVPTIESHDLVFPSTVGSFNSAVQALRNLVKLREAIPDAAFSAIGGLRPSNPNARSYEAAFAIVDDLRKIANACRDMTLALDAVQRLGLERLPRSVADLRALLASVPPSTQLGNEALLGRAYRLRRSSGTHALRALEDAQSLLREIKSEIPDCRSLVDSPAIPKDHRLSEIDATLKRHGVQELSIAASGHLATQVDFLRKALLSLDSAASPGPVARALARAENLGHWQRTVKFLEAVSQPNTGRAFLIARASEPDRGHITPPTLEQVLEAHGQAERVSKIREATRTICLSERLPGLIDLRVTQSALAARSRVISRAVGLLVDPRYRHARRVAYNALLPGVPRRNWPGAIQSCIELVEAERDWQQTATLIGSNAHGVADPARWKQAAEWFQEVTALARFAKIPSQSAWEIAVAFESNCIDEVELAALQAASRVADSEILSRGLWESFTPNPFTNADLCESLGRLVSALRSATELAAPLRCDDAAIISQVVHQALRVAQLRKAIGQIDDSIEVRALLADENRGIDSQLTPYQHARDWLQAWMTPRDPVWTDTRDWVFSDAVSIGLRGATLLSLLDSLEANLPIIKEPLSRIASGFVFNGAARRIPLGDRQTLGENAFGAAQILKFEDAIHNIFEFGLQANAAGSLAGAGLIDRALRGEFAVELLPSIYRRGTLERSLREFERTNHLLQADRTALEAAMSDLPSLDEKLRASNSRLLVRKLMTQAIPRGNAAGAVRSYTERGYIKHLLGLQRPRFEVQDLYRRSKEALRLMQPCVIATPSTVSEYLPRDSAMFDLLIMDEASQVTPESALGSIARARQAVIVGDPQQLPPTNFFMGANQSADDPEDDDSAGITDVESILERAISALHSVHLKGHYRSRHHSLISFSNKHFYKSGLVTTLSVAPRDSKLGIVAHHIQDGRYSASINENEAIAVAQSVINHLTSGSKESIGVVAFNAPQAALIETHLEAAARTSQQAFNAYSRARQSRDPLFIRNLESVQGDERDVIFISYTYGPETENGVVAQRFGPILREKGERRLNVLVTRARNRVEVFHSLLPSQIVSVSKGAQIMRAYLEYARQTPEFDVIRGAFESDFEEEVARAIERLDERLLVTPQVGCEGFRIDLGVSLRANPQRFILGVECDGATFHSSKHARDRDLIRQTILEQHGWTIHRVWSTAWWKNAPHELERLANAVRTATRTEADGAATPHLF